MFGKILFVSQLLTLFMCVFPLALRWPLPFTLIFMTGASVLVTWVLFYNRIGNWSVLPQPKKNSQLIEKGPYRWMRHPMYSALLLGALGFVFHNQTMQSVISFILLVVILLIKARYEERLLIRQFPQYQQYKVRVTNRFVPRLPWRKLS